MSEDHAIRETGPAEDRENVLRSLNDLYHESRHMLTTDHVTLEDARKLSAHVTNVRLLLTELGQIEDRLNRSERTIASIHDLKKRYGELEGMVKEMRNILDRKNPDVV